MPTAIFVSQHTLWGKKKKTYPRILAMVLPKWQDGMCGVLFLFYAPDFL